VPRTMSGGGTAPEGPVQGPQQYFWHHYRKPWRRRDTQPAPEQLLNRCRWRTSARLAPEGGERRPERAHLRLLSLPRSGTLQRQLDPNRDQAPEGQARAGSLRRILPYLRSLSEPGSGADAERLALRKVGSNAERRAPTVSSFINSLSRRISRVRRAEPEPERAESGRTAELPCVCLSVCLSVCLDASSCAALKLSRHLFQLLSNSNSGE